MDERAKPGLSVPPIRSFHYADYSVDRLRSGKRDQTVSVCLPARNEESTVGRIVAEIRRELVESGVVDELIVVDDSSSDSTADRAARAGAQVFAAKDVLPEYGEGAGKGEVLWKSVFVSSGDIVVWCDSDLQEFHPRMVSGVLGPLLCEPDVEFSKGFYRRPEVAGTGGGRVTELVARPLISMLFPPLSGLVQPLSGEYGARRSVLEQLPFVEGYGVEMGLLIDYLHMRGTGGLVQVDLDVRYHRNRSLEELGPQAMSVAQTILRRADRDLVPPVAELLRPGSDPVTISLAERPPLVDVAAYLDLLGRESFGPRMS